MSEVLFLDSLSKNVRYETMDDVPRIGDTIPLFYTPAPKVLDVIWFPRLMEGLQTELRNADVCVIIG